MVELRTGWKPSRKLNAIAGELDFTAVDPLPEGVTRDEIEEYCYTLRQLYGDYVDEVVAETTLSQREAQAWVLRNLVYEDSERLSYGAVGLYIWAIGRATDGDPLSRTIVSEYYQRAERKIERAEETVKRTGPPPYPDDVYEEPALLWVDREVGERLRRRTGPEETYSDVLERLLDRTVASLSVESLVADYREACGSEYAAVETVKPDWDATLEVVVQLPEDAGTPPSVAEADVLTVDGRPYEFAVEERTDPRRESSHVVLFSAAGERIAPEEGHERLRAALEAVESTLRECVESVRESGGVALAVDHEPAAAGAHLYPVYPPGTDAPADSLADLERIELDDRTLTVGRVSPLTAGEYGRVADGTTLLWAAEDGDAPTEPRPLPDDPAEARERFPTRVLRTA